MQVVISKSDFLEEGGEERQEFSGRECIDVQWLVWVGGEWERGR